MENYKPRIIDKKIEKYLSIFGAICIEGPMVWENLVVFLS